ncbi:uncharacterized protein [Drosophila pseudoobscura]|uniref:RIIa domain-containing protein n=1 Tax=Drosophila pseudoobscura pseudoobscura TaxID=46245 RepID=A0A6I8VZJ1_DROPS|nr:uncharacterized protein LOC117184151 [Drosophila pseudoobscura]
MTDKSLPRVPEGLRDLMKMYAKEVLRQKPENLYKFSADFFNLIVTEKSNRVMRKYEPIQTYESMIKNRIQQQMPLSLVFHIIPENLTELIKQFIKAVLKESPDNIYIFAQEYFQKLSEAKSITTEYTKYTEYEGSLRDKEPFKSVAKVTCQCGRTITGDAAEVQNNDIISSTMIPLNDCTSIAEAKEENQKIYDHNCLKAVIIIQRNFRRYKIQKKISSDKEKYDKEYLRAVFLIQRLFRCYLAKKRFGKRKDSEKEKPRNDTHSTEDYIHAVIVIQRQYRRYLNKKIRQKNRFKNGSFGLVTAAIIIQRAFRRMVDARRVIGNVPDVVDNREELNDIYSETCSYNSVSTAPLSTDSTTEHKDFVNTNFEDVIQNTIKVQEEVDNNNPCLILENEYAAIKKDENSTKVQKNDDLKINEIPGLIELSDLTKISISEKVDNSLCENGESDIITHPVSEQHNEPQKNLEDEDNATGKTNKDNGAEKEFDVLPDKEEQTIVIGSEISESGHRFSGEQDVEIPVSSALPKELDGVIELSDLTSKLFLKLHIIYET